MELGQDFEAGDEYEARVQSVVDRGYGRALATAALRVAGGDAAEAVSRLERGEAIQADEEEPETEGEGNPLAFLLGNEDFLATRSQLRAQPSLIPTFLAQLQAANPDLYALVIALPEAFQQLLDSPAPIT